MLKYKDVLGKATDYVDKQLSWSQAMAMAMHLLMCGDCRRFIKYFRLSLSSLSHKKTISVSQAKEISSKVIAGTKPESF